MSEIETPPSAWPLRTGAFGSRINCAPIPRIGCSGSTNVGHTSCAPVPARPVPHEHSDHSWGCRVGVVRALGSSERRTQACRRTIGMAAAIRDAEAADALDRPGHDPGGVDHHLCWDAACAWNPSIGSLASTVSIAPPMAPDRDCLFDYVFSVLPFIRVLH